MGDPVTGSLYEELHTIADISRHCNDLKLVFVQLVIKLDSAPTQTKAGGEEGIMGRERGEFCIQPFSRR
jgi:hypothetical protein